MNGMRMLKRAQRREWFCRIAVSLLLGVGASVLTFGATVQAASFVGNGLCTAARRGVALALPAVVRIATTYQAQLFYTTADGTGVTFPQGGGTYTLSTTASGAFISANGDVLTANSAVNESQNALDLLLAARAAPDIAQALNDSNPSQTVTAADVLNQLLTDSFIWRPSIETPRSVLYLSSQYSGPTEASSPQNLQSYPLTILAPGLPNQQANNDLALLHVDGLRDLPTIPLGDSSQIFQGDTLTIIGYPDSADLPQSNGLIDPNNFLTASVKTVMVSAFKTAQDSSQLVLVDGNVEQGNGGAPALNADGQLVGVVSFAAGNSNGSGQAGLLQMGNAAKSMAQQAKVSLAQDAFDERWAAAYDACASSAPGHWHDAYAQYTQIARLYPNFKGVQLYVNYTKAQAAHEPAPGKLPGWGIALIVALILAFAVAGFILLRRRSLRGRGAYAGYGPGLNKGAPYSTTDYSIGAPPSGQQSGPPVASEQIGVTVPAGGDLSTPPDPVTPAAPDAPPG
ncbi:MAG TPA: serine protease [Ktedonobacterales bacterium]|jgi:S1-C subfamily serine protease